MKSMRSPLEAIFFMTYFDKAGGMPPLCPPPGSTTDCSLSANLEVSSEILKIFISFFLPLRIHHSGLNYLHTCHQTEIWSNCCPWHVKSEYFSTKPMNLLI